MKPTIGRIVHYVSYGTPKGEYESASRAAVITQVVGPMNDEAGGYNVGLCILNPTGQFFTNCLPQDEATKAPGTWHWPPRE